MMLYMIIIITGKLGPTVCLQCVPNKLANWCIFGKAVSEPEQSVNMIMRQEVWLQIAPLFQRRVLEASVRRDFYSRYSLHSGLV